MKHSHIYVYRPHITKHYDTALSYGLCLRVLFGLIVGALCGTILQTRVDAYLARHGLDHHSPVASECTGPGAFECRDTSSPSDGPERLPTRISEATSSKPLTPSYVLRASISMYSRKDSCSYPGPNGKCLTASGSDARAHYTVACPRTLALGTRVRIADHEYYCLDRTAEWVQEKYGPTFDIFTESQKEARTWGRKVLSVEILPN